MYRVSLTESYFPAIRDPAIEKITVGDLLRRQAEKHADRIALKEGCCQANANLSPLMGMAIPRRQR